MDLVQATRPGIGSVPDATEWLQRAGPVREQLIVGAKALALLNGRFHVTTADIDALAKPVLRHRIVQTLLPRRRQPPIRLSIAVAHCRILFCQSLSEIQCSYVRFMMRF